MAICVWLLFFSIVCLQCSPIVVYVRILFLFMAEWYFIVWIYCILFIHCELMDIWIVSTFWLLWTILLWTYTCKFLCGSMFSFLMGIYLGVNAGSYSNSMLSFLRNCQPVFCKVTAPFYIPTNNVWGFQFFHFLINTCYCLSFWPSHPSRVKWYLSLGVTAFP